MGFISSIQPPGTRCLFDFCPMAVPKTEEKGLALVRLGKELGPVADGTGHVGETDQVKGVGVGLFYFEIVDVELDVGGPARSPFWRHPAEQKQGPDSSCAIV